MGVLPRIRTEAHGVTTRATINENTNPEVPHFIGTRYVYNILTQNEPDYASTAAFAGINQLTLKNGFICQTANATNATNVANMCRPDSGSACA